MNAVPSRYLAASDGIVIVGWSEREVVNEETQRSSKGDQDHESKIWWQTAGKRYFSHENRFGGKQSKEVPFLVCLSVPLAK